MVKIDRKNIEYVGINYLLPYAKNHNTHSNKQIDQIAKSIEEFGFTNPVIVTEDNVIRSGHGRVLAAKKLGIKNIPCIYFDEWSDAQAQAYVIVDNQLARNAEIDNDILKLEIEDLKSKDFDVSLLGLDLDQYTTPSEGLTDPDEVPEVQENIHGVERGQIWLLGDHRVMCGDSTSKGGVNRLMDGKKAEILFTSPPYSDRRDYNGEIDLTPSKLAAFFDFPAKTYFVDPHYCSVIIERWQKFTGKEANLGN